ncbi:hypothetical protein VTK56DRAFT_1708 [Thermocarpiscus australiensis]
MDQGMQSHGSIWLRRLLPLSCIGYLDSAALSPLEFAPEANRHLPSKVTCGSWSISASGETNGSLRLRCRSFNTPVPQPSKGLPLLSVVNCRAMSETIGCVFDLLLDANTLLTHPDAQRRLYYPSSFRHPHPAVGRDVETIDHIVSSVFAVPEPDQEHQPMDGAGSASWPRDQINWPETRHANPVAQCRLSGVASRFPDCRRALFSAAPSGAPHARQNKRGPYRLHFCVPAVTGCFPGENFTRRDCLVHTHSFRSRASIRPCIRCSNQDCLAPSHSSPSRVSLPTPRPADLPPPVKKQSDLPPEGHHGANVPRQHAHHTRQPRAPTSRGPKPAARPAPQGRLLWYVPMLAFFTPTDETDIAATQRPTARLLAAGVAGLVVHGSNGEAVHLSRRERRAVLEALADTVRHETDSPRAGARHRGLRRGLGARDARAVPRGARRRRHPRSTGPGRRRVRCRSCRFGGWRRTARRSGDTGGDGGGAGD